MSTSQSPSLTAGQHGSVGAIITYKQSTPEGRAENLLWKAVEEAKTDASFRLIPQHHILSQHVLSAQNIYHKESPFFFRSSRSIRAAIRFHSTGLCGRRDRSGKQQAIRALDSLPVGAPCQDVSLVTTRARYGSTSIPRSPGQVWAGGPFSPRPESAICSWLSSFPLAWLSSDLLLIEQPGWTRGGRVRGNWGWCLGADLCGFGLLGQFVYCSFSLHLQNQYLSVWSPFLLCRRRGGWRVR